MEEMRPTEQNEAFHSHLCQSASIHTKHLVILSIVSKEAYFFPLDWSKGCYKSRFCVGAIPT